MTLVMEMGCKGCGVGRSDGVRSLGLLTPRRYSSVMFPVHNLGDGFSRRLCIPFLGRQILPVTILRWLHR